MTAAAVPAADTVGQGPGRMPDAMIGNHASLQARAVYERMPTWAWPAHSRFRSVTYAAWAARAGGRLRAWDVGVELVTRSPAQYWKMISEHVSLAVGALAQVSEPARERIAKAVIAKVSTDEENGTIRIPGLARCIVGTK
jgi:hypothetical protein